MLITTYPSFREVMAKGNLVRLAGAHSALGGALVEEAGFDAVWASSLEISAGRRLPDASLLTMTDYLAAAEQIQSSVGVPVVADVDTGFGGNLNVAHMVREYERAGITAVCIEDKHFPKMNSFVDQGDQGQILMDAEAFCEKLRIAKSVQESPEFYLIARTETYISGMGTDEALRRCAMYADAGADAVLVHSKIKDPSQVEEFLAAWDGRVPVVIVPTTYPDWHATDAHRAGVSVIIYANQALRATVQAVSDTLRVIKEKGTSTPVEDEIAPIAEVFRLQKLQAWTALDA
ncbi:isocitrate lyase/phosphoenolpyruvate mutase family protein [Streptomyces sp. NPDC058623]|uniref:isocitrate lyase/phosphoenolpyruvate mutase family protein n=1 Tax=Streptomyces sp. NPDC058623 TaxID=3346563 RepID=UPI00364A55F3